MDRRTFLRTLGQAAVAGSALGLSGCGRLLEQPEKPAAERSMKQAPSAPSAEETQTRATSYPDLAVCKDGAPGANLRKAMQAMGGIERFVRRGAKVVIKPNLLTARAPEYATTTNPALVAALVRLCLGAGASDVVVLDRPTSAPHEVFEVSGISAATRQAGGRVKILTDRNFVDTRIPKGRLLTRWPLVSDVFDADVLINMPIAKTHGLAVLTMAMKNLMGVMGGERGAIHVNFDQKIVDLNTLVKPQLVVLDAYRMLMRNGPTGGDLADVRTAKTVVVGTSQVAVDAYGATLFDMRPSDLQYLVKGSEQGLGTIDLRRLEIAELSA